MNGILVINKPKDYTSRDVVNILNKEFHTKKIGHTGTLDPIATGVLVVCIGKYTKLVQEITSYNKEYIASIKLGIKTDTKDITGNVIETKSYNVSKLQIEETLNSFIGKSIQEVPIYSAVKVNGKKLYEYARNNETIELPKREIEIYEIELLNFIEDTIEFRVKVSKGTYIRSLIEDICNKLQTVGTMTSLIRTKQGYFDIKDSYTIDDVKTKNYELVNIEKVLNYETINLTDAEFIKVSNGCKIKFNTNNEKILLKYQDELIAIYIKDNEIYKPYVMLKTN